MYVKCYLSVGTMFKEPIPSVYIGNRMIWKNTDIFLQEFRLTIEIIYQAFSSLYSMHTKVVSTDNHSAIISSRTFSTLDSSTPVALLPYLDTLLWCLKHPSQFNLEIGSHGIWILARYLLTVIVFDLARNVQKTIQIHPISEKQTSSYYRKAVNYLITRVLNTKLSKLATSLGT